MPNKKDLIIKLTAKPMPNSFTVRDLNMLLSKCNCVKYQGGRGSSIGYRHLPTQHALQFDAPHPGNELYRYQIKMAIKFLKDIGEI